MTPEQRIDRLERIIEAMRWGRDIEFQEQLRRRALQEAILAGVIDQATSSNINQTITAVPAAAPDPFDKRLRVVIDGTPYYIGLYNV